MTDEQRYVLRSDGLAAQTLDDEVVILDLRSSSYLLLNPTGALLWPLLEAGATLPELAAHLVTEFEIDLETATRDAKVFVDELDRLALLAGH